MRYILVDNPDALENTGNFISTAGAIQAGEEVSQQEVAEGQAAFDEFRASEPAKEIDILAFSYPDMCQFQILLYKGDDLDLLFESDVCMIETVSVDYGSQNKMTFFDAGDGGKYYPTDLNLTIALREAVLPTAASIAANHSNTTRTIF